MKQILLLTISFLTFINLSAQITPSIESVLLNNQTTVNNCNTLDFGTNQNNSLVITYKLSRPSTLPSGTGTVNLMFMNNSSSTPQNLNSMGISDTNWSNQTFQSTISSNLSASEVGTSGSYIYIEFVTSGDIETKSCNSPIIKTIIPTFTLSPNSVSLPCGNTSSRTFTVTSSNVPSGSTVTYNWSHTGWTQVSSTTNSKTLQPSSGTVLPSTVTVTPYINGVAQSSRSSTVSRATFSSTLTISGPNNMCNSASYSVNTSGTNLQVIGWNVSNSSIASISGSSNSATLTATGNGVINITATLQNPCGQTTTISKSGISIGTGAPVATGFDVISQNTHYTPNGNYGTGFIICPIEYLSITPKPYRADVLEHQWTVTGNYSGTYNSSSPILSIASTSLVGATFQIKYRARSACGWGPWTTGNFTNMDCDGGEEPWFVYPNPSSETLTIEKSANQYSKGKKGKADSLSVTTYSLYDFNGSLVKEGSFNDKTTLDVSKLKKGRYVLKAKGSDNRETIKHIIIN